jgi:hypothetical protein
LNPPLGSAVKGDKDDIGIISILSATHDIADLKRIAQLRIGYQAS